MSEAARILKIVQNQQKILKEELATKKYLNNSIRHEYDVEVTAEKLLIVSTILNLIGPVKQEL